MMRTRRLLVAAITATALAICFGGPATASESGNADSSTAVDKERFGPRAGLTVTTERIPVVPGAQPIEILYGEQPSSVEGAISPLATWGTSYATSTEIAYLYYQGRAKAAGNVYNNQRIIKVCIQYTQAGRTPSDRVCSSASSTGASWIAGPEVTTSFWDNLSDNWPATVFNIETTRIAPNVY